MRKPKTRPIRARKTRSAKRKPAAKSVKKRGSSLQARLESEFAQALKSAKSYVKEPERLRGLVKEAAIKASSMPKETFKGTWAYFQAMLRLIRAYYRGDYRAVPMSTLLVITAAIIYVVNPFDFLPDWIPGLGLLDDAFVVAFAVQRTKRTLDDFMSWEIATLCHVTTREISRLGVLFLVCLVSACERHATVVEFSLDTPPPTFMGGATCEYRPTAIEKPFYDRLSEPARITLQTKPDEFPDESHAFKLRGHEGEFVSWWGIVRNIKCSPDLRSATLLIENKYFDGSTDCNLFESISICSGGDFETELTDIPDDLIPLVLVRVYGIVTNDQNKPLIKADYVRVWHWGQFAFFSVGEDHGNPEWKKRLKLPPDENPYILRRSSKNYYGDHLGPTAEQMKVLRSFYQRETRIQFANIPLEDWTPTAGYAPTEIEKWFFGRLTTDNEWTVQAKPSEPIQSHFQLRGHVGQFVSWFGIVRQVMSPTGKRGGRLLIENKYFDGATDDHPQTVSTNGGGNFIAETTNLAEDLPLTLVRVYGPVVREERAGPVVLAEYIRVWRWGEFKFNDYGEDHGNPYWKRSVKPQPEDYKQLSAEYYVRLLGPTAKETNRIKEFFEMLNPDKKLDELPTREVNVNPSATP